jgi:hypothetical protein
MHHEQLEFPEEMFEPELAAVNIRDASTIPDSIRGFDFSVTDRIANPAPDAESAWIPEIRGNRREGILAARDGGGFRASVAAAALVVTFGAGWFGGSHAQRLQHLAAALNPFAPVLDASPSLSPPAPEAAAAAESPAKVTSAKTGPDTSGLTKLFDSAASTAYKPAPVRRAAPAPSQVALVSPENAIAQAVAAQREEKDPPRLTAAPETRPGTIAGWTVRRVDGGTAVLEGPGGSVFQVRQGDTVPGVGRVDSIVLWGGRWIVSTATGLIATQ